MLQRRSELPASRIFPTHPGTLLPCWGSFSSSVSFFFFPQRQKKSLYSHNKNKSVLYFTIYFKYFHCEALISSTWSRGIPHFPKTKAARARLGGAPGAAALDHLLHLVHEGRAIRALEGVFPPLAPQGSTALPSCTPASAFQPGHLLRCLASGVALLLLVIISYPFPSTRDFWKTAKAQAG